MYFDKEPDEPVLILLFESAEPYRRLAKKWFGDDEVPHDRRGAHAPTSMSQPS